MTSDWSLWLLIFIGLQIFVIGALAVIAIQHARAHFRPAPIPESPHKTPPPQLPAATRERLQKTAEEHYQSILDDSARQLQKELAVTTGHINNLVMRLATEVVSGELERYRNDLSKLHQQAAANLGGIRQEVAAHQGDIEASIKAELEAEKQRLLAQIDTKLADAVGSFLTETLQHNVDLGSQNEYLVNMLEEHKSDFKKEVGEDGTATA